jgi:hypothetical protein
VVKRCHECCCCGEDSKSDDTVKVMMKLNAFYVYMYVCMYVCWVGPRDLTLSVLWQ